MNSFSSFASKLHQVNEESFTDIALNLFRYQAEANQIYKSFLNHLNVDVGAVTTLTGIPFLPISFFKRHAIQSESWNPEVIYTSSGTTGSVTSRHMVRSVDLYHNHAVRCFEGMYGSLRNFHILALLPSYLERSGSSLISMVSHFIEKSGSADAGFYLNDIAALRTKIEHLRNSGRQILLWGVTFALLDLADQHPSDLSDVMIMETGGMKGRGKEITRAEFYGVLREKLNCRRIYSEYGMTELMSQAYTAGEPVFRPPASMKVIGRDMSDPMHKGLVGETAGLNIIDLANIHSVAFLETEDLGRVYEDGTFEILGRMDNSDVRGCNLLL